MQGINLINYIGIYIMKKAYLHNIKYAINKGFRLVIRDGEDGELLAKTYGYKEAKGSYRVSGFYLH